MQVTARLAALGLQALQQPDDPLLAFKALNIWLDQAVTTMRASPESLAAASVRQQLQDSQLLQHLGPAMDAAAARLTAAVAALIAAASSGRDGSSSTAVSAATQQDSIQEQASRVYRADKQCGLLLGAFRMACRTVQQGEDFCEESALPAAAAAMRLVVTGFQACSQLQQLWQQKKEQLPVQVGSLAVILGSFVIKADLAGLILPVTVYSDLMESSPAGRELLLSPDFLSCLTIALVVTVLGLDISSDGGIEAAATPAASSSSAPGVESSVGSSSRGSSLSSGVRLDSLTPLSCSLFDVLGVSKEIALQTAKVAKAAGIATVQQMRALVRRYRSVLGHQVSRFAVLLTPCAHNCGRTRS
jgi:hypothetical protein